MTEEWEMGNRDVEENRVEPNGMMHAVRENKRNIMSLLRI